MKYGLALLAVVSSLGAGACAAPSSSSMCPTGYGSCDAVTNLDARLMRAPICVFVEVAPEDPCSCEGAVTVINGCDYEVVAQNFSFDGSEDVIAPGGTATFEVVPGEGPVSVSDEQAYRLVGNGAEFEVVVDYGVTEKSDESGCSVSSAGRSGRSAGAWLALAALSMLVTRRRRRG